MTALLGKVALVIGGTRGIGGAISRRLAANGASLAVIYRSRTDEAEHLVRETGAQGWPSRPTSAISMRSTLR